jgi:DNA polymerase
MDERRRRAWGALGLGPAWALRDPPATTGVAGPDTDLAIEGVRDDRVGAAPEAGSISEADRRIDPVAVGRAGATTAADVDPVDPERTGVEPVAAAVALAASPLESVRRDPVIAALPWPALADAVSGCTACGLCRSRRNTVFGVGPNPASWMFVGEAPGEQEDERGEPFVGPAGRLLDQMLAAVGVDRASDAFIANVMKCRPPGNRNPTAEEIARCEPYLLRQVELLRPRLLVVLGRFAAQSLLRTDASIASLRGRVHRYRAGGLDLPLVVTYHPAYLLRTLPDKAKAWADLRLARRVWDEAGPG